MSEPQVQIRHARAADAGAVAILASELAQSFAFSPEKFDLSYPELLTAQDACLLLAASGDQCLGYLLGFRHLTFYANGPVAWAEEVTRKHDGGQSGGFCRSRTANFCTA